MASEVARAPAPAPRQTFGPWQWLRANLFNSWLNTLLTLLIGWLLARALVGVVGWAVTTPGWQAVRENLRLFFVGTYPAELVWRVELGVWVVALLLGLSAGLWRGVVRALAGSFGLLLALLAVASLTLPAATTPATGNPLPPTVFLVGAVMLMALGLAVGERAGERLRWPLLLAWFLSVPFVLLVLVRGVGGEEGALAAVPTSLWGGLLVTMALTVVGIIGSFPLGILLALGRRSRLPIVRAFSTIYIEVVRGVPLVTVFFMAQLMLPLFLPQNVRVDNLVRAMVAVTLFSAAYLAENVRGGLQSLPKGQTEAAQALGLSGVQTTLLITLPQALRAVIPALVGQFIALFKDTSLVTVVGLFDLLGIAQAITKQPAWLTFTGGVWREVFLFTAAIYFLISFTMSRVSQRIERRLGVGQR